MSAPSVHIRLPADRFHWSIIKDHGFSGRRLTSSMTAALDLRLADDLPVPLEEVNTVYATASQGAIIACSIPLNDIEAIKGDAVTLCPESLPAFAAELGVDPYSLNLLTGPFEPVALRVQNRTRVATLAAAMALVCGLVCIGLTRRAHALTDFASRYDSASNEILATAIPADPRPAALAAHLTALRRAQEAERSAKRPIDASTSLATLLKLWPRAEGTRTDILSITPTSLSATVTLTEDPQPFLRALKSPPGWTLAEPRLTNRGKETQVSIQYDKAAKTIGEAR